MNELREDILTIFTPVYNRAHLLGRLFDSLKRQTCQNFEWIALDDGSTDNSLATLNNLRNGGGALFPVIVLHTENGGKHRAMNRGVLEAHGEYFMVLDSDDYLLPDAVENIHAWIKEIKQEPDYKYFAGVSGLDVHEDGKIIGGSGTGEKYVDANIFDREKYNLGGDKAEVYKTVILKRFPFAEFDGEKFLVEYYHALIATAGYKLRWYPVKAKVCEYLPDGLTQNGESIRLKSFDGHTYATRLTLRLYDLKLRARAMIVSKYGIMAQKKGFSPREAAKKIGVSYFMMRCSLLAYKIYQPIKKFIKHRRN